MVDSPVSWLLSGVAVVVLLAAGRRLLATRAAASGRFVRWWVGLSVGLAAVLTALVAGFDGGGQAVSFLGEYAQEAPFVVDTSLVFALVLRGRLPQREHEAAALLGIAGAMVVRAAFVLAVNVVLSVFQGALFAIGALLVYKAVSMVKPEQADDDVREPAPWVYRLVGTGRWASLPPMVAAVAVLTLADPLAWPDGGLAYPIIMANVLALLPVPVLMRYADRIVEVISYLPFGVATTAAFIGVKVFLQALSSNELPFLNAGAGVHWAPVVPPYISLLVTVLLVGLAAVISLIQYRRDEAVQARDSVSRSRGDGVGGPAAVPRSGGDAARVPVTVSPAHPDAADAGTAAGRATRRRASPSLSSFAGAYPPWQEAPRWSAQTGRH